MVWTKVTTSYSDVQHKVPWRIENRFSSVSRSKVPAACQKINTLLLNALNKKSQLWMSGYDTKYCRVGQPDQTHQ